MSAETALILSFLLNRLVLSDVSSPVILCHLTAILLVSSCPDDLTRSQSHHITSFRQDQPPSIHCTTHHCCSKLRTSDSSMTDQLAPSSNSKRTIYFRITGELEFSAEHKFKQKTWQSPRQKNCPRLNAEEKYINHFL